MNATRSELSSARTVMPRATWLASAQSRGTWPKSSVITALNLVILAVTARSQPIGLVSNVQNATRKATRIRGARSRQLKLEVLEVLMVMVDGVNTTLLMVVVEVTGMMVRQPMLTPELGVATRQQLRPQVAVGKPMGE